MKVPEWLAENVAAFGRSLGVAAWHLSPGGSAAALRFEGGKELLLEVLSGRVWLTLSSPFGEGEPDLRRLLGGVMPEMQEVFSVQAALHPCARRVQWRVSCPVEEAEPVQLGAMFRSLLSRAESF